MPILYPCYEYLSNFAIGKWEETYTMLDKETGGYKHKIQNDMMLLRVETGTCRAFYWIYNLNDAKKFNIHVGLTLKWEAHEIIIRPYCRLFFDIDLQLDEFEKIELAELYGYDITDDNEVEVIDSIGKTLADVFKQSTLISLEEHGNHLDEGPLVGFDWIYTMRNRPIINNGYKISIHLITNLMLDLAACAAIAKHIKSDVIKNNAEILQIDDNIISKLIESIDETQYRSRGSLGLPYGTKKTSSGEYTNYIHKDYNIPHQNYFITIKDSFNISNIDLSEYNIENKSQYSTNSACPEFVKEALRHVNNIEDYNTRVWDINASILKGSTMYVKRYAPSMCTRCNRTHDNDNTLFLIFDSEKGIASWKCSRNYEMIPIKFYEKQSEEIIDEIEVFAKRRSKINTKTKMPNSTKPRNAMKSTTSAKSEVNITPKIKQVEQDSDLDAFVKKRSNIKPIQSLDMFDPFDQNQYNADLHRNAKMKKIINDNKQLIAFKKTTNESKEELGDESEGYSDAEESERGSEFDIPIIQ